MLVLGFREFAVASAIWPLTETDRAQVVDLSVAARSIGVPVAVFRDLLRRPGAFRALFYEVELATGRAFGRSSDDPKLAFEWRGISAGAFPGLQDERVYNLQLDGQRLRELIKKGCTAGGAKALANPISVTRKVPPLQKVRMRVVVLPSSADVDELTMACFNPEAFLDEELESPPEPTGSLIVSSGDAEREINEGPRTGEPERSPAEPKEAPGSLWGGIPAPMTPLMCQRLEILSVLILTAVEPVRPFSYGRTIGLKHPNNGVEVLDTFVKHGVITPDPEAGYRLEVDRQVIVHPRQKDRVAPAGVNLGQVYTVGELLEAMRRAQAEPQVELPAM